MKLKTLLYSKYVRKYDKWRLAKIINYDISPGDYSRLPGDISINKAELLKAKWKRAEKDIPDKSSST